MTSRESLKAQRHELYCTIADALQDSAQPPELLGRLQAVLEAEACLSHVNGDADSLLDGGSASIPPCSAAAVTAIGPEMHPSTPAAAAVSALQQLRDELARHMHQSVQQQHHQQQKPRQSGKFMSCSSLLADLRAVQRAKGELEQQLESLQDASTRQRQRFDKEVRVYRQAAEQATSIAEAANNRLAEVEQQCAAQAQVSARQMQQLAEQAQSTVHIGAELRQVKQQMQQLHLNVVQPLLRWQHEQQRQHTCNSTDSSSSSCSSHRKHAHKRWKPPSAVTPELVCAAAAAVEQLLSLQSEQGHETHTEQQAVLKHSRKQQQRLQDKVSRLEAEVRELHAELEAARADVSTGKQHVQQLQQQLATAAHQAADAAREQQHSQHQHSDSLQQQVNRLLSELAHAQGEAAAAQRQIARLQEEQRQAAAEHEQEVQQLRQAADVRLAQDMAAVRSAVEQEHSEALAAVKREAQQQLEAAQQGAKEQAAALERSHLQAMLRHKQVAAQERQEHQRERDALVAQYTASGMQLQQNAREQLHELQQQVQQLQREKDALLQDCALAAEGTGARGGHLWRSMQRCSIGSVQAAGQASTAAPHADCKSYAAVKCALEAERTAAEAQQQLVQQEQEVQHLRSALEELRRACAAANSAAAEAEASAAATTAALHEQVLQVQQLQKRLEDAEERHGYELRAVRESAAERVRVVRAEAAAELEGAQTRLQLVRLKQQRLMQGV